MDTVDGMALGNVIVRLFENFCAQFVHPLRRPLFWKTTDLWDIFEINGNRISYCSVGVRMAEIVLQLLLYPVVSYLTSEEWSVYQPPFWVDRAHVLTQLENEHPFSKMKLGRSECCIFFIQKSTKFVFQVSVVLWETNIFRFPLE